MAPKGIACARVLPTTQIQYNTNTELSLHNRHNKQSKRTNYKTRTNYSRLQKEIKHNKKLGIALVETLVHGE